MHEPLAVTVSRKALRRGDDAQAVACAQRLGVPYVPCVVNQPAEALLKRFNALLVWRGDGVMLLDERGTARWSAGMADLRIRRLDHGIEQPDHVLLAGEVRDGDHVLDCTLGRGHDALVLARAVGPHGRVEAMEASLPLYAWVSEGLRLRGPSAGACAISCEHTEALEGLKRKASGSVDCVFFDPMFDKPQASEAVFDVVRRHAVASALTPEVIAEARRVARRWVVVKAAPQSRVLRDLGLEPLPFKRSADLRFGRLPAATLDPRRGQ